MYRAPASPLSSRATPSSPPVLARSAPDMTSPPYALTGRCHVIELDKMRLFIYIPWTKSEFLTLFTYTLTGLFANNVFFWFILFGHLSAWAAHTAPNLEKPV
jgi:hypothetical protein